MFIKCSRGCQSRRLGFKCNFVTKIGTYFQFFGRFSARLFRERPSAAMKIKKGSLTLLTVTLFILDSSIGSKPFSLEVLKSKSLLDSSIGFKLFSLEVLKSNSLLVQCYHSCERHITIALH